MSMPTGRGSDFWQDFPSVREGLQAVRTRMAEATRVNNPVIEQAVRTLIEGDGKMLRPALVLVSSEFGRRRPAHLSSLAAALELLHVATLVHDDVIDDSPLRRGQPAAWSRFGRKDAVLTGDFLLSRCLSLTAAHTSPRNAQYLAEALGAICRMEIEQDAGRFQLDTSIRTYTRRILGKTALLFSLACHVGATESKADALIAERLRRAGYAIGMAFQIIDDILDYEADRGLLRKPTGNDLRAGVCTLPLICALRRDQGPLRALLERQDLSAEEVESAIAIVKESGGLDEARRHARRYTERALREIAQLQPSGPRQMLSSIARRMLEREY